MGSVISEFCEDNQNIHNRYDFGQDDLDDLSTPNDGDQTVHRRLTLDKLDWRVYLKSWPNFSAWEMLQKLDQLRPLTFAQKCEKFPLVEDEISKMYRCSTPVPERIKNTVLQSSSTEEYKAWTNYLETPGTFRGQMIPNIPGAFSGMIFPKTDPKYLLIHV